MWGNSHDMSHRQGPIRSPHLGPSTSSGILPRPSRGAESRGLKVWGAAWADSDLHLLSEFMYHSSHYVPGGTVLFQIMMVK